MPLLTVAGGASACDSEKTVVRPPSEFATHDWKPTLPHESPIAAAYDGVAAEYDRLVERDQWMRRALWRHFARVFRRGDTVLDVGCGTGRDTIYLASLGVRVTAIDVSPGMMAELRTKLAQSSLASAVDARVGDTTEVMAQLPGPFDGLVSSFAVLNTVDLRSFGREAARLLRPGGRLVAHVLSPGYGSHGAKRLWRSVRSGVREVEIEVQGRPVRHALLSADELFCRGFAPAFVRRQAYALGLIVGREVELSLPGWMLDLASRLETKISTGWPLTSAGRFFVVDLERRSQ